MAKAREDVERIIRKNKKLLKEQYNVKTIGVFGSFARGEQAKGSDVDILVDFYVLPDLLEFVNLERYLEKILKRKVDLVRKQVVRPELRRRIFHEVVYL